VPAARDARLRRVTEALHADPSDNRDLAQHADAAGASARTLARLFRRETGMSFDQWRRQLRLAEAAARLAQGESPARAAAAVGYASGPAFGAAFRAAFGTTPGQVRVGRG
jgi:AraC-like DNA-binding protein